MPSVALKMLLGDSAKYLALVFGVAFATLLMSQQVSIFIGLMTRTANQVLDVREADIWVMDPRVRYVDEVEPLPDAALTRVRSVEGVEWAAPLFKGLAILRTRDGLINQVSLVGVDDETLVGAPREWLAGDLESLRTPGGIVFDKEGAQLIWPEGDPIDRVALGPDQLGTLLVENDAAGGAQGLEVASQPLARRADQGFVIDTHEADLVDQTVPGAEYRQALEQRRSPLDALDRTHPGQRRVGQGLDLVDVAHSWVHHPDVGLPDIQHLVGGAGHQADEDRHLLAHQQGREGHAENQRQILGAVAEQHLQRDGWHSRRPLKPGWERCARTDERQRGNRPF